MNSTVRFTDRVENYVKARPGYPRDIVLLLESKSGLTHSATLVDVGCGTGLLAKPFCEYGCPVIGIEPNAAMREAGQQFLSAYPNFEMMDGTAESMPLPGTSVDFIIAGQAFHWFNQKEARHEFMRILKPNGWAALIWNDREFTGSKFAEDYENLLVRFGVDYAEVHQRGKIAAASLEQFFGNSAFEQATFPNDQQLDHDGFVARIRSSSYMPSDGHPNFSAMMDEIEQIFGEHRKNDTVTVRYQTNVYFGQMS